MAVQDDAIGGEMNGRRLAWKPIVRPASAVAVPVGAALPPQRRFGPVNPAPPASRVFRAWAILSFEVCVGLTVVSEFPRGIHENA